MLERSPSQTEDVASGAEPRRHRGGPVAVFLLLSLLFGPIVIALNPPMRGPDEAAHFLRAYGLARGEIIPRDEQEGRVGIWLPADIHAGLQFFDDARYRKQRGTAAELRAEYAGRQAADEIGAAARPRVFVPYQGTESYVPTAYVPEVLAALIGRALDLGFVPLVYLMRAAAFLATTAIVAYAIALTPWLKWAFLLIGMLPAAFYGRTVIGADGATVALTLLTSALALRALKWGGAARRGERAVWMTLCVLSKPPQLVFLALEALPLLRTKPEPGRWRTAALVVLPGLVLSPLWILATAGEMAAWRVIEGTGLPPEQFDPVWKMLFLFDNPLHFPRVMAASFATHGGELWWQLIGVLGWLDTRLLAWVYPVLTALLVITAVETFNLPARTRWRVLAVLSAIIAAYVIGVYLILFLTWTPTAVDIVWGVQGRYFLVVLPAAAAIIALAVQRLAPNALRVAAGAGGALIAAVAVVEALMRSP